jgi:hypothetical protein
VSCSRRRERGSAASRWSCTSCSPDYGASLGARRLPVALARERRAVTSVRHNGDFISNKICATTPLRNLDTRDVAISNRYGKVGECMDTSVHSRSFPAAPENSAVTHFLVVSGADLRVGDTLEVWWTGNRDTITAIRAYTGPLACLKGARLADFALLRTGMTIEPGSRHVVVSRTPTRERSRPRGRRGLRTG